MGSALSQKLVSFIVCVQKTSLSLISVIQIKKYTELYCCSDVRKLDDGGIIFHSLCIGAFHLSNSMGQVRPETGYFRIPVMAFY